MYHEVLAGLPPWLVWGVTLGLVASVATAGAFYLGVRAFPEERRTRARRVDGDARRRAEIRQYLGAIGEAFAEDHFVEGQEVAFYLPKRDVAITFDPRAYYRIGRGTTHAVLVEHEMPGTNLGYRLPFETPTISVEKEDGEGIDPREAAYAVLGLPSGAGVDEIKAAYREKVKEVHPDHGGDEEQFKRVREAYTTAKEHAPS